MFAMTRMTSDRVDGLAISKSAVVLVETPDCCTGKAIAPALSLQPCVSVGLCGRQQVSLQRGQNGESNNKKFVAFEVVNGALTGSNMWWSRPAGITHYKHVHLSLNWSSIM